MPGARCARSRACSVVNTRVSHHGHTGKRPAFPAQWFYGLLRALPGDRLVVTVACGLKDLSKSRSGRLRLRKLDASAGASGPHDFAVRVSVVRQRAVSWLTGRNPPCHHIARPTPPASTASRLASVTIASRPSERRDRCALFLFLPACQRRNRIRKRRFAACLQLDEAVV
jgi:hypothetical protein